MSLFDEAARAMEEGGEVTGAAFEKERLEGLTGSLLEFVDCAFTDCAFGQNDIDRLVVSGGHFTRCDLSGLALRGGTLRKCTFTDCRMTGFEAVDAAVMYVRFEGCALNYASFSSSRLQSVSFYGCPLDHGAFSSLRWKDVAFSDCSLHGAEFRGAPLKDVDLRSCDIRALRAALPDLVGCVVRPDQAMELSALLGLVIR